MNDNLQTYIEPELEARLLALVMGEASAFETGELERLMDERPEVKACKERLEKIHGVLAEAYQATDDSAWRLSDERRAKVLAKVQVADEEVRDHGARRGMGRSQLILACAACLMVGLVILVVERTMSPGASKSYAARERKADRLLMASSSAEGQQLAKSEALADGRRVSGISDGQSSADQSLYWDGVSPSDAISESNSRSREVTPERLRSALAELDESLPATIVVEDYAVSGNEGTPESLARAFPVTPAAPAKPGEPSPPELPNQVAGVSERAGQSVSRPTGYGTNRVGGGLGGGGGLGVDRLAQARDDSKMEVEEQRSLERLERNGRVSERLTEAEGVEPDLGSPPVEEAPRPESLQAMKKQAAAGAEREKLLDAVDSDAALANARDGGLKKNQSRFLNANGTGGTDASPEPGSSPSSELAMKQDKAAKSQGQNFYRAQMAGDELGDGDDFGEANSKGERQAGQGPATQRRTRGIPRTATTAPAKQKAAEQAATDSSGNDFFAGRAVGKEATRSNQDFTDPVNEATIPDAQPVPTESARGIVTGGLRGETNSPRPGKDTLALQEKQDFDADGVSDDPFASPGVQAETMPPSDPFAAPVEEGEAVVDDPFSSDGAPEPLPESDNRASLTFEDSVDDREMTESVTAAKLKQIVIPEVDFKDVTLEEAVKFLETRTRELDSTTLDSDDKGLNFRFVQPQIVEEVDGDLGGERDSQPKIKELKLQNVPTEVALDYIAEAAMMRYRVDADGGVTFLPLSAPDAADLVQRKWEVGPDFVDWLKQDGIQGGDVKSLLQENGVDFVANSTASFLKESGTLIVRNLPNRLDLVDQMVTAYQADVKKREEAKKEAAQRLQERENFETSTAKKSDSTFSLNVSDVSFKLAKSALAEGKRPEVARVRPEEFVNALDYGDERPTQAEKIACAFEQSTHPFLSQRNLMRISMSTASLGRNAATPLRLTLLLDQSGSMERVDRAESVKRAFALLAAQLTPNDEVTLIGFARTPRLLAERVKGNEAAKLAAIVANPVTEGGTNLEEALSTGFQLARQQYLEGAQNRVILLTDGAANLGDARPENLVRQVESMRRAGIAFDACGVGADGLNDEILSSLAKEGDGRYYFLDRPEDADEGFARQIAGALRPAASNVKVQVLFNPERVASFYLYGFEKHRLKKEDFRNDAVDAAEMAAEESGVALYHYEPVPDGRGDVGTVSVRFLDTASNQMVERTWAIPYDAEVAFFNEAEPKLRLAGVAGLFAENLKASPVGERVELKGLRQELEQLKPRFGDQTRFQELQTMTRQAGE